jgi:hypothetical protein
MESTSFFKLKTSATSLIDGGNIERPELRHLLVFYTRKALETTHKLG